MSFPVRWHRKQSIPQFGRKGSSQGFLSSTSSLVMCCPGTTTSPKNLLVMSAFPTPSPASCRSRASFFAFSVGRRYSQVFASMMLLSYRSSTISPPMALQRRYIISAFKLPQKHSPVRSVSTKGTVHQRLQILDRRTIVHWFKLRTAETGCRQQLQMSEDFVRSSY